MSDSAAILPALSWTFSVSLPVRPPTANHRLHWAERHRLTRQVRGQVALVASSERHRLGVPKASTPRRLELCYLRPPREASYPLDGDNLVASLKPVVDALVDSCWLRGDGPADVDYPPPTQAAGTARAVVVTVTAL